MVVLSYIQRKLAMSLQEHNITVSMKPQQTLHNLLVHLTDKQDILETYNCVYQIKCRNCDSSYIGETGNKLNV